MGRAQEVSKLSLAEWAKLMGVNPLHFEGVRLDAFGTRICDAAWMQYSWQNSDAPSREDIGRCIAEAESNIERALGWRLLPSWEEDEWAGTTRPFYPDLIQMNWDARGFGEAISTKWKNFISGGIRSQDLVAAASVIVWTDPDGDGYFEWGTVTAPTVALNSAELHVYYPGHSGDPAWEIRPIQALIAAGVATITFRRELCVLEDILESLTNSDVPLADGTDDADFLDRVDIYRVYNDPQRQVQMLWEPFGSCACGTSGCTLCAYSYQYGCLHSRGPKQNGLVVYTPATWNTATKVFDEAQLAVSRQPDIVRLWYYAGLRDGSRQRPDIEMAPNWARTVACYAAALLDRPPCTCNQSRFEHWQEDLAYMRGADELNQVNISMSDLDNPFGTRRGAVNAWKQVTSYSEAAVRTVALI